MKSKLNNKKLARKQQRCPRAAVRTWIEVNVSEAICNTPAFYTDIQMTYESMNERVSESSVLNCVLLRLLRGYGAAFLVEGCI
jgi:hypothetical protein